LLYVAGQITLVISGEDRSKDLARDSDCFRLHSRDHPDVFLGI